MLTERIQDKEEAAEVSGTIWGVTEKTLTSLLTPSESFACLHVLGKKQ